MQHKTKVILYGILLILGLPASYLASLNLEFQKSDFKTIEGILLNNPAFSKGRKASLTLKLENIDYRFVTDGFSYHILDKNKLKSQLKKGDKVFISVKKDETASWVDKINKGLGIVNIMEIWTDEESYITINDYNKYRKEDFKFTYLFWVFGLGCYIYWINKNRKNTASSKA